MQRPLEERLHLQFLLTGRRTYLRLALLVYFIKKRRVRHLRGHYARDVALKIIRETLAPYRDAIYEALAEED